MSLPREDEQTGVRDTAIIDEGDVQPIVEKAYSAQLPTVYGQFQMTIYHDSEGKEHVALVMGTVGDTPLVRVHSECLTGDVFGSVRCDCQDQLHAALTSISEAGCGVVVYLRQEGRGIGLTNKIH